MITKSKVIALSQADFNEIYATVLSLVKKGLTVERACINIGMYTTCGLYARMTDEQKKELRLNKAANAIYGARCNRGGLESYTNREPLDEELD